MLIGPPGDPEVWLGVPHHAPIGVERIALERPEGSRIADENAVLYALVCLEALLAAGVQARLAVASQARDHDPNKDPRSVYCQALWHQPAALLVECHGAGSHAPHELELSAGANRRSDPLGFGQRLAEALGPGFHLAAQSEPGVRHGWILDADQRAAPTQLRYPALRTRSLEAAAERGMAAFHLEAKLRFRSAGPRLGVPTPSGRRLGLALASAIRQQLPARDGAHPMR
ncbi:MAG: hypothetical protein AAF430_22405 [Myxococcota bacterium]